MSESDNHKRIAKNTLMLYLRMFIILIVGLYTSRVVLNVLGVSDYGLYNVVGGIVSILTFLNAAMVGSSQRYISYELGVGDRERLNRVFCTSINIHFSLALIVFVLAETVGLWFLNTYMNIEPSRMVAANWVYQCSILSFLLDITCVPFSSTIVAHERMGVYAYFSILQVILKLLIVYCLLVVNYDKLIVYAILSLFVSLLMQGINITYCRIKFSESKYHFVWDKQLFREMFSFAGWSIFGSMGFSFKDQLSNIILNLFFGTTVNAARGIAMTVNNIVNSFASNFLMAMNPQITKQYASGNIAESQKLVYAGSRYSFYLMTLIMIPVFINVNYILHLWLGIVPQYTSIFLVITLICSLLYTLTQPVTFALQATGNIKAFQIGICIIMLSEIPIAYVILKMGGRPYMAMYPSIATSLIAIWYRFFLMKRMIPSYSYRYYGINVLLRCASIFILSFVVSFYMRSLFQTNFVVLCLSSLASFLLTASIIFGLGITKSERNFAILKIKTLFHHGQL